MFQLNKIKTMSKNKKYKNLKLFYKKMIRKSLSNIVTKTNKRMKMQINNSYNRLNKNKKSKFLKIKC